MAKDIVYTTPHELKYLWYAFTVFFWALVYVSAMLSVLLFLECKPIRLLHLVFISFSRFKHLFIYVFVLTRLTRQRARYHLVIMRASDILLDHVNLRNIIIWPVCAAVHWWWLEITCKKNLNHNRWLAHACIFLLLTNRHL